MARAPDIDTLSTYYRTLNAPSSKGGEGPPSLVLGALRKPGVLPFDDLRQATQIPPVELADVLRNLEDLQLVKLERVGDNDEVRITPEGERFVSNLPE